jgi:multiple sugar transport system substrate-binding protein
MPELFPLPGDDIDAPEDDNPSDGKYGDYDGSEVTIRFAHTMGYRLQQVLNAHIQKFNELYPNIHVEHNSYGGWSDIASQINVEITAGNQPNIAYCYSDHVAGYNLANAVVTLDELINSTNTARRGDGSTENVGLTHAQADDFIDGFYDEGKVYGDGKMYTLPLSKSTDVLYYNKTFFEKNGLTVPTTWEEMETVCAKILELDSTCIPLGYDSEANWFITMCAQYGNDYTSATGDEHFLFNNDGNKAFVKMLRQWYQNGYTTTQNLYGGYTSGLFTELEYTRCYMCIGSSAGATYQIPYDNAFEVGVAPIPQVSESNKKVISQGPNLCILKSESTSEQEIIASWLFMKYLTTSVDFQTEFSSTSGYMPVLESAQDDPLYSEWLSKADGYSFLPAYVAKVCLEQADGYFATAAFNGSSVAREQVGLLLTKSMSAETTDVDDFIDRAFQDAYDECIYQSGS